MTMLSGPMRARRPCAAACPNVPLTRCPGGVRFELAGVPVEALAGGALWLPKARTLVVSDVHLEKGSAYAVRGQFLPPYDTRSALGRLSALMDRLQPDVVISLGDSFHDRAAHARMAAADVEALRALVRRADWIWIEGNHDPEPPAQLGGRRAAAIEVEGLRLRHEPTDGPFRGEIAGHLHPCARVSGRGRSVRARCFATDGVRLIMPAFGAYAGGLNVRERAFDGIFPNACVALMLGQDNIHPAPATRLLADAY